MKVKRSSAVLAMLVAGGLALAGCSASNGGNSDANRNVACSTPVVHKDAPRVVVWGWWNAMKDVVKEFNNTHSDVQVCYTNAGQSNDEYPKLRTALKAGTGAPDVAMIENDQLASFAVDGSVVDLTKYGVDKIKSQFSEGAWKSVSLGDKVYEVPVDGGPLGLYYRADLLRAAGISSPPKTWDEYAAQAAQYKAAGVKGQYGNFSLNTTPLTVALFTQAGAKTFTYDLKDPQKIGIDLNGAEATKVLDYWQGLIKSGSVADVDAFSTDNSTMLASGLQATYVGASWGTGVLQGLTGSDPKAEWRVAPLPQWDASDPQQVAWGGSGLAVTKQAADPKLAATVAEELYGTAKAMDTEIAAGDMFPARLSKLNAPDFQAKKWDFFGGQQIIKDVFGPAAQGSKGQTFSPFSGYLYSETQKELVAGFKVGDSAKSILDGLQKNVSSYATQQGLKVQ